MFVPGSTFDRLLIDGDDSGGGEMEGAVNRGALRSVTGL